MKSYIPPLSSESKSRYNRFLAGYLGFLISTPLVAILMGYAIWKGFMESDNSMMYIALPVTMLIMFIKLAVYDNFSMKMDSMLEELNPIMWENTEKNVSLKYGDLGEIKPYDDPTEISPPDGGFLNTKGMVMWFAKGEEFPERVTLTVDKKTFEPTIVGVEIAGTEEASLHDNEPISQTEPSSHISADN